MAERQKQVEQLSNRCQDLASQPLVAEDASVLWQRLSGLQRALIDFQAVLSMREKALQVQMKNGNQTHLSTIRTGPLSLVVG